MAKEEYLEIGKMLLKSVSDQLSGQTALRAVKTDFVEEIVDILEISLRRNVKDLDDEVIEKVTHDFQKRLEKKLSKLIPE